MTDNRKTKDIKDLKARLGRKPASSPGGSVPPGTARPSFPPGLGFPPGSRPPGAVKGPASRPPGPSGPFTPSPGAVRAPFAPASQPGRAPAPAPGSGIVAPPFARKPAAAPAPAAKPRPASSFGTAAPPVPEEKKVTFVVDDTALRGSKRTKRAAAMNRILLIFGFVGGVAGGLLIGMTSSESRVNELADQDELAVRETMETTSKPVSEAGGHIQRLASSLNSKKIDYTAVERLVALKRPMATNAFHRRFFDNFQAEAVDDLFRYAHNVDLLWGRFAVLGAKTAGQGKRAVLDEATKTGGKLKVKYGLAIRTVNDNILGGLVFVTGDLKKKQDATKRGNAQYEAELASRLGGKTVTKMLYSGQSDFIENPGSYTFLVDEKANWRILGEPPNLFDDFKKDVDDLNAVMQQTLEIQGRLAGK